jgi:hypothetical protein
MALGTGDFLMLSFQGERRLRLVIESIGGPGLCLGMTAFAMNPSFPTVPIELPPVHIPVAGGAGLRCF